MTRTCFGISPRDLNPLRLNDTPIVRIPTVGLLPTRENLCPALRVFDLRRQSYAGSLHRRDRSAMSLPKQRHVRSFRVNFELLPKRRNSTGASCARVKCKMIIGNISPKSIGQSFTLVIGLEVVNQRFEFLVRELASKNRASKDPNVRQIRRAPSRWLPSKLSCLL